VTAFWLSLLLVFVAEMGDKTQFMTLTFSTRYPTSTVIAAVAGATLLISLFSVLLGLLLGTTLPFFWINLLAGLTFIAFGLWAFCAEEAKVEKPKSISKVGPFLTVSLAFFLAELGDRTMLATVMIAAREKSLLGAWLGSSIGLSCSNMLAIPIGRVLGKKLPRKSLKYITATIFVVSGLFAIAAAWKER
jgi:Ca2+/H+ antiporter, TMEM165/GDT1 family